MHPSKEILERFVNRLLTDKSLVEETREHLLECVFCREYCEQYSLFLKTVSDMDEEDLPAAAARQAEKLHQDAVRGTIIPLRPLLPEREVSPVFMAADGKEREEMRVRSLATLYSEKPEVVLRIMRDEDLGYDYLQLISDERELISSVMIQLPEIGREFITDETGLARIEDIGREKIDNLKWQIKLPEAAFVLEPLKYDPDRVEYSKEVVLETDRGDKISVTFEGKTEGKQVSIQILELDGTADYHPVRVNLSCESVSITKNLGPNKTVSFGPVNPSEKINIRLFQ